MSFLLCITIVNAYLPQDNYTKPTSSPLIKDVRLPKKWIIIFKYNVTTFLSFQLARFFQTKCKNLIFFHNYHHISYTLPFIIDRLILNSPIFVVTNSVGSCHKVFLIFMVQGMEGKKTLNLQKNVIKIIFLVKYGQLFLFI
jgi:hypothetical protein